MPSEWENTLGGTLQAIRRGYEESVTGLALRRKLPESPAPQSLLESAAGAGAAAIGDLPVFVPAAAGGTVLTGSPIGGLAAGIGATSAARQTLRELLDERDAGVVEAAGRISEEATKGLVTGGVLGYAGKFITPYMSRLPSALRPVGRYAAEVPVYTTAQTVLEEQRLPNQADLAAGAASLLGIKAGMSMAAAASRGAAETGGAIRNKFRWIEQQARARASEQYVDAITPGEMPEVGKFFKTPAAEALAEATAQAKAREKFAASAYPAGKEAITVATLRALLGNAQLSEQQVWKYLKKSPDDALRQGMIRRAKDNPNLFEIQSAAKAVPPPKPTKPGTLLDRVSGIGPINPIDVPPLTLPKYAINVNLNRMTGPDDAKRMLLEVASKHADIINEERRGVITRQAQVDLAESVGLTPGRMLKRQKGEAWNAETLIAAKNILHAMSELVWRLNKQAQDSGDLYAQARFTRAWEMFTGLQAAFSGAKAEAGRALAAGNISSDPATARQQVLALAARRIGGADLTAQKAARLMSIDPEDKVSLLRELREMQKVSTSDKLFEVWINGLLSGVRTHEINTISNMLTSWTRVGEKGISGVLDWGRSRVTGSPQERFPGEMWAAATGWLEGLPKGVRKGLIAYQTELPTERSKIESIRPYAVKGRLGRVVRIPSRALMAEDEVFKAVAHEGEMYAQAYRQAAREGKTGNARVQRIGELLSERPPWMQKIAGDEALYVTFQKKSGPGLSYIEQARNNIPGLRYVLPFIRTPANVAKFGLERTPLNMLRVASLYKKGVVKGGQVSDELAKVAMGSLIAGAGAALAAKGLITGGGPQDPNERRALRASGWQPYSAKIGNQYLSYGRFEPLGITLGLTADAAELFGGTLEEEDAVGKIALAFGMNLSNKTFLSGVSDLMNAVSDPERYGQRWMQRLAGSVVPTVLAHAAQSFDPSLRRPTSVVEAIQARIPILSQNVPALRDVWGQPVLWPTSGLERYLSPVQRSPLMKDPASLEVSRLRVAPGSPSRALGAKTEKLTQKEYDWFVSQSGAKAHELVNRLVSGSAYARLNDDTKKELILKQFYNARRVYRPTILAHAAKRLRTEGKTREASQVLMQIE